jgi:predicted PurR-regulated permease PerM
MQNTTNTKIVYDISILSFFKFSLVLGLVLAAWLLKDLLIAILVSVVIATPVSNLADKLRRFYIPRGLTVFVTLLSLITVLIGTIVLFIPLIGTEIAGFMNTFPKFQLDIRNFINTFTRSNDIQNLVGTVSVKDIASYAQNILSYASNAAGATASAVTSFIFQTAIIFILSFYLAVQEKGVERFLRLISPVEHEDYLVGLWSRSQVKIQAWANGQLLLGIIIAVIVYVALSILGVEHALLLALLAGICELIPIVGMTMATIPAIIIAYLTGGLSLFFKASIFYLILGQFENHILAPAVVNKVVGIPSLIVIIALIIGGVLAGFWGILLAVPVAATIMEWVSDIENSKKITIEHLSKV